MPERSKPSDRFNETFKNIDKSLNMGHSLRYNEVLKRVEIRYMATANPSYKALEDRDFHNLFIYLNKEFPVPSHYLKIYLYSDMVKKVNPFSEYFKSLPKWDHGSTDYIARLASTIRTQNDDFWRICLRKWLIAVVACAIEPLKVNQQVLILVGKQGIGKTRWLNRLLPDALKDYIFSGTINPNNKDTLVHLSENLLINLDELENLNKAELGSLKSVITQEKIRLRRPYGEFNEVYERRASFMGSVNHTQFLNDPTGNRRYLCFTVEEIKTEYMDKASDYLDISSVYSQAHSLFLSGEKWWFDGDEIDQINKNNEEYLNVTLEEELLLTYFSPAYNNSEGEYMTPTEILSYIQLSLRKDEINVNMIDNLTLKRLGMALVKNKFEKHTQGNQKPYLVKKIKAEKEEKTALNKEGSLNYRNN